MRRKNYDIKVKLDNQQKTHLRVHGRAHVHDLLHVLPCLKQTRILLYEVQPVYLGYDLFRDCDFVELTSLIRVSNLFKLSGTLLMARVR